MDNNLKDIIRRQSATIALMFTIILILFVVIICLAMRPKAGECGTEDEKPITICGNAIVPAQAEARVHREGISGNYENGITLFKKNCAVCHTTSDMRLTGPGLKGVYDRVPKPAGEWLKNFILNNEKVIKKGDPYANKVFKDYSGASMTVFEGQLSEQQVNDIIAYIAGN